MKASRKQSVVNSTSPRPRGDNRTKYTNILTFFKRNYLLFILAGCIGLVGVVGIYKLFMVKPTYIYAKVKVGQGTWWASTQKPSLWYVKAIQEAIIHKDLTKIPTATVLDVSFYPYYATGQYDVYVTVKLKVSPTSKKDTYSFNRETIGVSSPIDLVFPSVQFSGTVIALSDKEFNEAYIEKTIYVTKRIPYPWEYEQIVVGDSQTNGKKTVFTIIDKSYGDVTDAAFLQQGTLINTYTNMITVKARILVKKEEDQYVFGEEYGIIPGKTLQAVATKNFTFSDFYITKIE